MSNVKGCQTIKGGTVMATDVEDIELPTFTSEELLLFQKNAALYGDSNVCFTPRSITDFV